MTRKALFALLIAAVISMLALPSLALAAGGNGSGGGDGSGGRNDGGNNVPTLVASNPADGSSVSIDAANDIWLQFSNNVAEPTVSADNIAKVHLQKEDGTNVAVTVNIADTQVEPDKRQYIYITPDDALEPGQTYVIVADAGITAKNGNATKEGSRVTFTIEGSADAATPSSASTAVSSNASSGTASSSASSPATSGSQQASGGIPIAVWVVCGVIVVAIIVIVVVCKGRKSSDRNEVDFKGDTK